MTSSRTDWSAWFEGKTFTTDWTSHVLPTWVDLFADLRDRPVDVLEVGSWEGRSAVFFLNFLARSRLTCVDTFAGGAEHVAHPDWADQLPQVEDRFRANTAEFGDRVRLLTLSSTAALELLAGEGAAYDLVYIDGSHHAADVLADATGSWPLVRTDGWLVFDDYEWRGFEDPARTPRAGVDAFLAAHRGQYVERHRGWQLAVQRLGPDGP